MRNDFYDKIVMDEYDIGLKNDLPSYDGKFCYLALISALKRDFISANQYILLMQGRELSDEDRAVCLEARSVINYFSGNFNEAEKYAEQALALSEKAFFARSLMARMLTWKRRFKAAIEHYRVLLEMYPSHSRILLDLASCMLANKGNYNDVLGYVIKAKKSFRRNMYLILIPLGKPFVRLLLACLTFGLFSIPQISTPLFGFLTAMIALMGIITLIKVKLDLLIITRLIGLQVIISLTWLLAWIAARYWW